LRGGERSEKEDKMSNRADGNWPEARGPNRGKEGTSPIRLQVLEEGVASGRKPLGTKKEESKGIRPRGGGGTKVVLLLRISKGRHEQTSIGLRVS